MLNENQIKFIEYYLKGNNISEIAKKIGVSRTSVYKYLANSEVKTELDKRSAEIRNQANNTLTTKLDKYIANLEEIAFSSDSDKTRADVLQYLVDRVLGKSTSKVADVTEQEKAKGIDLDADLDKLDKVIDLKAAK